MTAEAIGRLDEALEAAAGSSRAAARHGTRSRLCPACWARPGRPCTVAGPDGDHLARWLDAERAGCISRAQLTEVVAGLEVIAAHAIVRPSDTNVANGEQHASPTKVGKANPDGDAS
jgi:hypothetical protein